MRLISLALVVFALVLTLGVVGAARGGDSAPQLLAATAGAVMALAGARDAPPKIMSPIREDAPLRFCGQCTGDSDCGTDHKCCGPSSCRECFRVDTCP